MELKIEYISINKLVPYKNNTRKHRAKDIEYIKNSIREFGMNDPIGIWSDKNIIVEGHGRLLACKKLGIEKVPCIRLDDLTDEQRRAYAIAHNSTAEMSEWNNINLDFEIKGLDDFEFSDFGIEIDEVEDNAGDEKQKHQEEQENTQDRVENILNLAKGQFYGDNKYDIPDLEPVTELPEIKEWISFNEILTDKDPTDKGVHFFIDDYQFERIWRNPEKYVDKLREYAVVATPDFSPYGDMPLITQLWNHYRKHWVGAWLQTQGVTIIPTIRCSTDRRSLEWYLDGEPRKGIVIISTMWTNNKEEIDIGQQEYDIMKETLNPCKIFLYGGKGGLDIKEEDNIEIVDSFTQSRWKNERR